jgi:hypothetical protein
MLLYDDKKHTPIVYGPDKRVVNRVYLDLQNKSTSWYEVYTDSNSFFVILHEYTHT